MPARIAGTPDGNPAVCRARSGQQDDCPESRPLIGDGLKRPPLADHECHAQGRGDRNDDDDRARVAQWPDRIPGGVKAHNRNTEQPQRCEPPPTCTDAGRRRTECGYCDNEYRHCENSAWPTGICQPVGHESLLVREDPRPRHPRPRRRRQCDYATRTADERADFRATNGTSYTYRALETARSRPPIRSKGSPQVRRRRSQRPLARRAAPRDADNRIPDGDNATDGNQRLCS